MNWMLFWLVLHVLGAILAFGPTYTFPIIGSMAQKAPQHAPFALRLQERVSRGVVLPLAVFVGITGVGLLFAADVDLPKSPYLIVAIGFYLIALANGLFVLVPGGSKLVHMVDAMTGAGGVESGPSAAAAAPAEFLALIRRQQVFGAINGVIIVVIVVLMVVQPGGLAAGPLFG